MDNQHPVPRFDFAKMYPRVDFGKMYPRVDFGKMYPRIDLSRLYFPKKDPFPDGFFKSMGALDDSSKYPLGSLMAQGAAFEECLSQSEADFVLASGEAVEVRWSAGELWESLTAQQQRLIKLGYLAFLFVSMFVAVFMAQTQYAGFAEFIEDAQIPAGVALAIVSLVGPNLMKTKTHPINKRIRRN
ncbi:hypothetical protein CQ018_11345 [Arthrobacter sp. MYb227]|uniref:hypothetical protein n=1 Tax=Arthrobacter sp. MYb227 TaxID=1848601 RepID=UPI000CFD1CFB|nr:hypothetical protein [Arthrobacter sp. MYb227]PQZ93038.1 hypothetical protein CQ018_11345 [Arthrobacter sp. MYb227]